MNPTASIVVCDAGPLIHLDELGCLDLLLDFSRILTPHIVIQEVDRYRPQSVMTALPQIVQVPTADIEVPPLLAHLQRSQELHAGELAALALTLQHPTAIFLTDDAAARISAQMLQVAVHGTIGILLRAIRRQQRTKDDVLRLLRELPARSTLHIASSLLSDIIKEVERY